MYRKRRPVLLYYIYMILVSIMCMPARSEQPQRNPRQEQRRERIHLYPCNRVPRRLHYRDLTPHRRKTAPHRPAPDAAARDWLPPKIPDKPRCVLPRCARASRLQDHRGDPAQAQYAALGREDRPFGCQAFTPMGDVGKLERLSPMEG